MRDRELKEREREKIKGDEATLGGAAGDASGGVGGGSRGALAVLRCQWVVAQKERDS